MSTILLARGEVYNSNFPATAIKVDSGEPRIGNCDDLHFSNLQNTAYECKLVPLHPNNRTPTASLPQR